MATKQPRVHALVTGPPGVGKTTLVQRVLKALQQKQQHQHKDHHNNTPTTTTSQRFINNFPNAPRGFYTQEVRASSGGRGRRLGFDVVTLDGARGPLARLKQDSPSSSTPPWPMVGRYQVDLLSFERIALPSLDMSRLLPPPQHYPTSHSAPLHPHPSHSHPSHPPPSHLHSSHPHSSPSHSHPSHYPPPQSSPPLSPPPPPKPQQLTPQTTTPTASHGTAASSTTSPSTVMKRQQLFVVDEIGKMELLSKGFVSAVRGLFEAVQSQQVHLQSPLTLKLGLGVVVLATVPVARHGMHPLVEELKRRKDCQLFEVTVENRDLLVSEITSFLMKES